MLIPSILRFQKYYVFKHASGFVFKLFEVALCLQSLKFRIIVLGPMDVSTKSENHVNDDFSGLPKENSKSYESKREQNTSTELSGYPF